jgi:hypothetical protein
MVTVETWSWRSTHIEVSSLVSLTWYWTIKVSLSSVSQILVLLRRYWMDLLLTERHTLLEDLVMYIGKRALVRMLRNVDLSRSFGDKISFVSLSLVIGRVMLDSGLVFSFLSGLDTMVRVVVLDLHVAELIAN